ncbi:glycine--tRNA ligase subunit beta [Peptoniphilus sp. AGMB00490]|uniref:Glycine--tRNA ligase beta subunit n=1 Tax=Peptoniphilus faecalis TaxID=2731255 RepID=A0A848RG01_9FIRM|nr:glycine--tRNA ligase subunit beta [Peptoniphilus faecalis]NMW84206.1 glycine--tRNA ligase subunit beta [Peptoniphilus faecalis]
MNNYLLEIGVEELPSRFVNMAIEQLKEKSEKLLAENEIGFKGVKVYATPRRLSLVIEDLDEKQKDIQKEVKGPSVKIAYDDDKKPTKPLLGFMKSQNISESDLVIKEFKGTDYVFANISSIGRKASEILVEIMPSLIRDINFPKNMRWGGKNIRFARPIRWIVSLLGEKVVPFDFEGISVGNKTKGHRFLGSSEIVIDKVENYEKLLEDNYVILDQNKRREIIKYESIKIAKSLGGEIHENEDLLEELTYIVEYPTPIKGSIKEKYLTLPKEVVTTTMIDHLRFIPIYSQDDKLLPYFITVRNGTKDYEEIVIAGNEKVLGARLEDAKFFYEDDISKPLEDYVDNLKGVLFNDKLGSMFEKEKRDGVVAKKIAKSLSFADEAIEALDRVAHLSKADLTTKMVIEFTELQGVMGEIYALNSGEKEIVATAIREQYLPKFAGDKLPESSVGSIFSLADKIDTIVGLFAIGEIPTGSTDPFALRRSAIGIINIIRKTGWKFNLNEVIETSLYEYINDLGLTFNHEEVITNVREFFFGRIKTMLQEEGIRYDIIDAVLIPESEIYNIFEKAKELNEWFNEDRTNFVDAYNRINNLTKNVDFVEVKEELLNEEAEKKLYNKFVETNSKFKEALSSENYKEAMDALNDLVPAIDTFFENVMVMSEDEEIRQNRLALINSIEENIQKILKIENVVE